MKKSDELFPDPIKEWKGRDADNEVRLEARLYAFTVAELVAVIKALCGRDQVKAPKATLCAILARLLDIQSREEFAAVFDPLPAHVQEAIRLGAFEDFFDPEPLERTLGLPVLERTKQYGYSEIWRVRPGLRLELVQAYPDAPLVSLFPVCKDVFSPWLPRPNGWKLVPSAPPPSPWSAAAEIEDVLPLLLRSLGTAMPEYDRWDLARKGMKRTQRDALRKASGLMPFSIAGPLGLDSTELLARFLVCFEPITSSVPKDAIANIKFLVDRFFKLSSDNRNYYEINLMGSAFEEAVLLDHLSRAPGRQIELWRGSPSSRADFRAVLENLAAAGGWVAADSLFEALWMRSFGFRALDPDRESSDYSIRGSELDLGGKFTQRSSYGSPLSIDGPWRKEVLARPLYNNYCFLFAVLGLLEIAEAEPPRPLLRAGAREPISASSGLSFLKLTELGLYCLGKIQTRPQGKAKVFEAIADRELLIIAFRGNSLERKLYLETIATSLGEERWRVTEASFIAGCDSPGLIEERIADFRRLIAPDPPPRWLSFFDSIRAKSTVLSARRQAYLIELPDDASVRAIFLEDQKLRSLVRRVEGGAVLVEEKDYGKVAKIMAEHGFWAPPPEKRKRKMDYY